MKSGRDIDTIIGGIACVRRSLVIVIIGAVSFCPCAYGQSSAITSPTESTNIGGAGEQSVPLRGLKSDSPTSAVSNSLLDPTAPTAKPLSAIVGRDVDVQVVAGHAPSRRMKALHVTVHNRSDEPLVFEGDQSLTAGRDTGSLAARCLTQLDLDAVDRPPVTFKGKVASDVVASATAAVSIGVVQTVDTVRREYGPIAKRYEYDQSRRTNEESRFGRRLLYPGDRTDGNIYFPADSTLHGKMLTIPVKSFYDGSSKAAVSVLIAVPD